MGKGKRLLLLAALAVAVGLVIASASEAAKQIWYVNAENQGGANGLAWQTAFDTIQGALARSRPGDEIWVAKGTYYPHASDRNVSLDLKKEVALYGGFSGRETRLDQRDYQKNVTILSGNIGKGDKTRNTVTIVKGADNAVLDGFTVSDAYATDEPRMHLLPSDIEKNDMSVGGGMRNFRTSPIVR